MSNHGNNASLVVQIVEKGYINKNCLEEILRIDSDFVDNVDYFRADTLKKGYKDEAERVSEEIYKKYKHLRNAENRLDKMVGALFSVPNFIGCSGNYGDYTYQITDVGKAFVISIAYVM